MKIYILQRETNGELEHYTEKKGWSANRMRFPRVFTNFCGVQHLIKYFNLNASDNRMKGAWAGGGKRKPKRATDDRPVGENRTMNRGVIKCFEINPLTNETKFIEDKLIAAYTGNFPEHVKKWVNKDGGLVE